MEPQDQQTETTGSNGGGSVTPPPVTPPQGNSDLAAQFRQMSQELAEIKAKYAALEKEKGTLSTANEQVNQQITQLRAELTQTKTGLSSKEAELTNLQTQFGQINTQLTELTQANAGLNQQVNLFNTIAGTPDFHPLIGMTEQFMKVVKPDAAPDDIKALLTTFAANSKQQTQATIDAFRAGATPAGNFGPGQQPTSTFKTAQEALVAYQQAIRANDQAGAANAYQAVQAFQNGKQPA